MKYGTVTLADPVPAAARGGRHHAVHLHYRTVSALLSIGAIVTGFILTLVFINANGWQPAPGESITDWLTIGGLHVDFGLKLDALSLMMLLIVTGVGGAIHIYSFGYMHDDRSFARFFAFMSLFTFSMLGIVLANNFIEMFIFWELVGVSSYLLIGFWFEKPSAGDAAKKAFIVNRLGDFGFLLGILMVWGLLGSLNFTALQDQSHGQSRRARHHGDDRRAADFLRRGRQIRAIPAARVAAGRHGRPDARLRPDPCRDDGGRRRLHALPDSVFCSMPTRCTSSPTSADSPRLLAALIAVQQNDIKRILAYSTLSQLGYMVMSVGLAGPTPAMFHLTTHAFFKALLFLGAGSVIHRHARRAGHLENGQPAKENAGHVLDLSDRHAGA